jgi:RND family efflux transporter MFP subunit
MPAPVPRTARAAFARRALLAALAGGAALLRPSVGAAQPPGIAIRLDDRQVRAGGIELARIEPEAGQSEIVLPGTVAVPPQQIRVVAAPAAGLVEALLVAPDEAVQRGQPLARLRSTELIEAQREYLEASARDGLARQALARDEQLFRERIIAERRLLTTRAEAAAAAATLDERGQLLTLLGMAAEELAQLRASRRIAPNLVVLAPEAAMVLQRHATPGERVAQSAPLLTLAQLSPLWVNVQVPLSRAPLLEQAVRVAIPAQGAEGQVLRMGRSADPATQSVNMVAEVRRGADALRPGQVVSVAVSVAANGAPQWRVPAGAVVRHRERHWVFRRASDGFRALPVTLLAETAQAASIRSAALSAGDQVAVRGIVALLGELADAEAE